MVEAVDARVSVVILTLNEEQNLPHALASVIDWSDDVHVVDSGSVDRTVEIAEEFGAQVHRHRWVNWAVQRNWSLDNCHLRYGWVLFLDADEQLTAESRKEIARRTGEAPDHCEGFYLPMQFYFLGRRVRNAMRPHLRLIRSHGVRWFEKGSREFCSAPKDSPTIHAELIHRDHRGIAFWTEKLTKCARLDAEYLYQRKHVPATNDDGASGPSDAKPRGPSWTKRDLLYRFCPPFARSVVFFAYRLLFAADIRDGWIGLVYAFFFGLWYPMLTDAMYMELCWRKATTRDS